MSRSVEELKNAYDDNDWRARYVKFMNLVEILRDCIIADDYVVPDEFNSAIKLTEAGNIVLNHLSRKDKVNPKDARLMCALTIGHDDLFIDIDATDITELATAIDKELKNATIRFPYTWGRELYDAYSDLYEDEKDLLTNEETLRLLDKLPFGVFQYGEFAVGPYGLRRSQSHRSIPGRRRVGAYHCSSLTCPSIHSVTLQTGQNASINRDRHKIEDYLQGLPNDPADWWALADELSGLSDAHYGDRRSGVLLHLIGDALTTDELRALVAELLDGTRGNFRKAVSSFLSVRSAQSAVEPLGRAHLLQLCLIAEEDSLATALDKLVREKKVVVPRGEVRRPVLNRNVRSGAFGLRPELGQYGVRYVSSDLGLATLRERRLLSALYLRDSESDVAELEWQLRGSDIDDLDEKLESFFQTRAPKEALERLILARKTNVITACHDVGIDSDWIMRDTELVEALMWKLGFPVYDADDPHADFWARHERLWALTQSSAIGDSERFADSASPYFTKLEGILVDSLAFTTWALLVDHTRSSTPFAYDDAEDRAQGLALLQEAVPISASGHPVPDYASEHVELRNLIEGFRTLARRLEQCADSREKYARPEDEFPPFDGKTDLKQFKLRSTIPFLDLSQPSQERIVTGLDQIGAAMLAAEVFAVRNDYAHYRRTAPDISRMEQALDAIRQSVTRLENLGFCRLLFTPALVSTDRWGTSRHEFLGPRSYEHIFARPTTLDWMGLPPLTEAQYLVRAASFGDPNEVLRFTRRYNSEFTSMWKGYPRRRRNSSGSADGEYGEASETEVEVAAN